MRVIIVGAGIGGLSTALALHRVGITDVVCLEASKRWISAPSVTAS